MSHDHQPDQNKVNISEMNKPDVIQGISSTNQVKQESISQINLSCSVDFGQHIASCKFYTIVYYGTYQTTQLNTLFKFSNIESSIFIGR